MSLKEKEMLRALLSERIEQEVNELTGNACGLFPGNACGLFPGNACSDTEQRHNFSAKYCRRRMRLLKRAASGGFSRRMRSVSGRTRRVSGNKRSVSRSIIIAAAVITVLLFGIACIKIFRVPGFFGVEYKDNTRLFAQSTEGAPETLEVAYNAEIPQGYLFREYSCSQWSREIYYEAADTEAAFIFKQTVKSNFDVHQDNEHSTIEQCSVGGAPGVLVENDLGSSLIWDCGDYILTVEADGFSGQELMRYAESAAPGEWFSLSFDTAQSTSSGLSGERRFTVPQGYTISGREINGGDVITDLQGERQITLRQQEFSGGVFSLPNMEKREYQVRRISLDGTEGYLFWWYAEKYYSVVWQNGGQLYELSVPSDPPLTEQGYMDMSADEDYVISVAAEIAGSMW